MTSNGVEQLLNYPSKFKGNDTIKKLMTLGSNKGNTNRCSN